MPPAECRILRTAAVRPPDLGVPNDERRGARENG